MAQSGPRDLDPKTVGAAVDLRAASDGDRIAFWWDDEPETFGEFRTHVRAAAEGLRGIGLDQPERFAIYLRNCPEFTHVWAGGLYIGVQPVTVNLAYKGDFLRHQLVDSASAAVVTSVELVADIIAVLPDVPNVRVLVVLGDASQLAAVVAPVPVVPFEQFCSGDVTESGCLVEPQAAASVIYTSGTTGVSKGVQLSHGHLALVGRSNCEQVGLTRDDVTLIPTPLYHSTGLNGILHALWAGCSTVFERRLVVDQLIDRLIEREVTVLTVVGPILQLMFNLPSRVAERSLKVRTLFGNPIPIPFAELAERYGIEYVNTAYGQTEVQPCIVGRLPEIPFGSCGRLHPNMEARIVDDDDNDVPVGQPGELILKPRVMFAMFDGYLNNPEANAEAFRDGWYRTGDILRQDEDGNFYWLDRKKDVVRRRGENISSVEVENVIALHSDVLEVAVHGVPSELGEEEVKAVVVLKAGASVTHEELHDFCDGRIPRFAIPRYIEFGAKLPRNPTGRVQKFKLREAGVTEATWDRKRQHSSLARSD